MGDAQSIARFISARFTISPTQAGNLRGESWNRTPCGLMFIHHDGEQKRMSDRFESAVIVGSLRKGSFTRKIASAMMQSAPATLHCKFVEIGDLPLYNEDMEGQVAAWQRFRTEIAAVDGVLFATPEYNRSIPGCLKNAIDVGSRPEGKNMWDGKAAGVVSATPYNLGGVGANYALRQALLYINMPVMQQPEAYISMANDLVNDDGSVKKEETKKFFTSFMAAFAEWVGKMRQV
jgi:chromate reductase